MKSKSELSFKKIRSRIFRYLYLVSWKSFLIRHYLSFELILVLLYRNQINLFSIFFMAMYGHAWSCMVMHSHVWSWTVGWMVLRSFAQFLRSLYVKPSYGTNCLAPCSWKSFLAWRYLCLYYLENKHLGADKQWVMGRKQFLRSLLIVQ